MEQLFKHQISQELLAYCELFSSAEPNYLQELAATTQQNFSHAHMLSGHLQGRFLSMISKLLQPKNILEIGTYTGYAALCLAEGLHKDGKLITIDIDATKQEICEKYFLLSPYQQQIELHIGDAAEIIPTLLTDFDLIFIDADKINYTTYYKQCVAKMKLNACMLIDNTLFNAEVLQDTKRKNAQAVHELNQIIKADNRVEQVLLPIRDGITMLRKIAE